MVNNYGKTLYKIATTISRSYENDSVIKALEQGRKNILIQKEKCLANFRKYIADKIYNNEEVNNMITQYQQQIINSENDKLCKLLYLQFLTDINNIRTTYGYPLENSPNVDAILLKSYAGSGSGGLNFGPIDCIMM
jgi:hypothetical protein